MKQIISFVFIFSTSLLLNACASTMPAEQHNHGTSITAAAMSTSAVATVTASGVAGGH